MNSVTTTPLLSSWDFFKIYYSPEMGPINNNLTNYIENRLESYSSLSVVSDNTNVGIIFLSPRKQVLSFIDDMRELDERQQKLYLEMYKKGEIIKGFDF